MKNVEIDPSCCSDLEHLELGRRQFLYLLGLASLAPFAIPTFASAPGKYFGAFSELPVGANKPQGWTRQWLQRQTQGLSGHPENMAYPYDTCMFAGVVPPRPDKHGEVWWPYEQSGYFFDAAARLNQLVDDPRIRQLHQAALDYILSHSTEMGYGASVWGWPNAVVGRGLLADYSATGDPKIPTLMEKYLLTHATTDDRNGVNAEEALYLYGITGDPKLLEYAQRVYTGYTTDSRSFCTVDKIERPGPLRSHGVSAAEMLKILPLLYLYTGDAQALQLTQQAYEKVVADSLMPDGGIVSSEYLGTAAFNSQHETCDITDWSWSMGYCLMATGDAKWADIIERTIFNALPGAVTKDFKQAQYFSGANQVVCASNQSRGKSWTPRMSYRAAHDTPCCVGNVSRAMPNYVVRQWMKTPDDGLAAVLYGPSELKTTVKGQPVTVTQETDYPFRETITLRIRTSHPVYFPLHLRIPGWCSAARIAINGQSFRGKTDAGSFSVITRRFKDGDVIHLTLPMELLVEDWFQGQCAALVRGPLVFSLQIEEKRVEITKDTPQVEGVLHGNLIQGVPAVEFYPQSEWRYGIGSTLKSSGLQQIKVVESPMTEIPFLSGQSPVHLELPLHRLPGWQAHWSAEAVTRSNGDLVIEDPALLPSPEEQQHAEAAVSRIMVPYGSTCLRLTTLPVVED
jgi:hypothetical protein